MDICGKKLKQMGTLTIKNRKKENIIPLTNIAQKRGMDVLKLRLNVAPKKEIQENKQARIVKEINQNITKRLLALHNL
jgi:hypothetical protein